MQPPTGNAFTILALRSKLCREIVRTFKFIMNFFVALLSLFAVLITVSGQIPQWPPHESQGGAHQNQGRIRRQADDAPLEPGLEKAANWTTCDVTTTPVISCHDCSTRLVCKPIGGLLIVCRNPFRPHCVNGTCSAVPSAECA